MMVDDSVIGEQCDDSLGVMREIVREAQYNPNGVSPISPDI